MSQARPLCRIERECHIAWFDKPVIADGKRGLPEVRGNPLTAIAGGQSECTRFDVRGLVELRAAVSPAAHILQSSLGANPMVFALVEQAFPAVGGSHGTPAWPGRGITVRGDFVAQYRKR